MMVDVADGEGTNVSPDTEVSSSGGLRGQFAVATVVLVGLLLLAFPAYGIRQNVFILGWDLFTGVLENSVLLLLSLGVAFGGIWLASRDWPETDTVRVAKWTIGGAAVLTVVYLLMTLMHLRVAGEMERNLLNRDGVVIGTTLSFAIGVYDVRTRQTRREMEKERQRLRSFLNATDVRIVTLEHSDDQLVAGEGNPAFDRTFNIDFEELLSAAEPTETSEYDRDQFTRTAVAGGHYHEEIRVPRECLTSAVRDEESNRETDGRFFDLRTVQIADDQTFAVLPDITAQRERRRLLAMRTEELARQKSEREQELEERTNQLKFLHSLLRHDVQNGMMVIDSRAEFLQKNLDGRQEEFAETIVSRSRDISDQIDRVRSTLDTLTEGTVTEAVDLSEQLEDRVSSFRDNYPNAEAHTDIDENLQVKADNILDDVITNLMRNAVEHNDKDQVEVVVSATEGDEYVRIDVADNGPGIPEEHRDDVFRRSVSGANDGGPGGSGFGLFFVDTMVESYGGDVQIEDSEPEGARFVIELLPAVDSFED